MEHPRTVRVAAVQAASVAYDLHKSMHKLRSLVFTAKDNGAEIVVFPEAFLSAYPRHLDFRIGSRSQADRDWYGRYVKSAVHVPSDAVGHDWLSTAPAQSPSDPFWAFKELAQIARKYALYLSVGVIECSNIGSTLWCTNLLFGPSGMLLSKHRKLQPTGAERIVWSQGEAVNPSSAPRASRSEKRDAEGNVKSASARIEEGDDNLPVVQTPVGRIGALICWENYMPLARYVMYKKGVEVYLAPTADGRQTWLPSMQHIAMEGRCYVITANQYQSQADFPAEYPPNLATYSTSAHNAASGQGGSGSAMAVDEKEKSKEVNAPEVWSRGGSAIVGPLGDVLAGPLWDKEGIIYADLDLGVIDGVKLDFDPVGHYSRESLLMGLLGDMPRV